MPGRRQVAWGGSGEARAVGGRGGNGDRGQGERHWDDVAGVLSVT